jgi:predicted Zn-dependent protease
VQLETEQPQYVKPAVANLEFASHMESNDPTTWQLLAVAYGRDGQLAMSALAQAEQAMASGDRKEARLQARRALKGLPTGSAGWLRANDIVSASGGPNDDNQEQMP